MIESMSPNHSTELVPIPKLGNAGQLYEFHTGHTMFNVTVPAKKPSFSIISAKQSNANKEPFVSSLQSDIRNLYRLPQIAKIQQIILKEEKYYECTYQKEVSFEAKETLAHVTKKLAEVDFPQISVELTLLNTAIFCLKLKNGNDTNLFITIPLTAHKDLHNMEVVYNLFVGSEEVVSNCKRLDEVLEGAKELIGQSIEFTTP